MTALEPHRPTALGRIRSGVFLAYEEEANALLRSSLEGVTSHAAKSDILTPWKERNRHDREVMASAGVVDPAIRRGIHGRVANTRQTWLNSRDGYAPPDRGGEDPVTSYEGYEGMLNIV